MAVSKSRRWGSVDVLMPGGGSYLHVPAGPSKSGEDALDGLVDGTDSLQLPAESRLTVDRISLPVRSSRCLRRSGRSGRLRASFGRGALGGGRGPEIGLGIVCHGGEKVRKWVTAVIVGRHTRRNWPVQRGSQGQYDMFVSRLGHMQTCADRENSIEIYCDSNNSVPSEDGRLCVPVLVGFWVTLGDLQPIGAAAAGRARVLMFTAGLGWEQRYPTKVVPPKKKCGTFVPEASNV